MTTNTHYLVYSGHWDRDRGQDYGRLTLNCLKEGNLKIWTATTTTANRQTYAKQFQLYGSIPANNNTTTKKYTVNTTPEDSRHVRGVEGSFYRVNPYEIITTQGTKRTAIGIHKDAGAIGSLGCIVLTPERFLSFEKAMRELRDLGITQLPLQVQFS